MAIKVIICDVAYLDDSSLAGNDKVIVPAAGSMRVANPYFNKFRELADAGDKRITLINGRFEDLVDAIPDLVAQTERERHADRIRLLRESPI
jgi:hypothetical protein